MPELCGYVVLLRVQSGHGYVLPDARCIRESEHIGFHVYDTFTPEACEDERTAHQTTLSDNVLMSESKRLRIAHSIAPMHERQP